MNGFRLSGLVIFGERHKSGDQIAAARYSLNETQFALE